MQVYPEAFWAYTEIDLGEIKLSPFSTHHDAYEPLGYAIEDCLENAAV
ncbi:hypothetical protein P7H19_15950 [Paenibacillus larvae]|nr:hypothetical protein [Paenibacillus larvae]MDT2237463.1 hypothetical protein [Paenibacillus larvae]